MTRPSFRFYAGNEMDGFTHENMPIQDLRKLCPQSLPRQRYYKNVVIYLMFFVDIQIH